MKRFCQFLLSLVVATSASLAATSPGYTNLTIVRSPGPIDAKVFVNQGQFIANFDLGAGLPFDFQNTEYFWNQGIMAARPGFKFDLTVPGVGVRKTGTFLNDRDGSVIVNPTFDQSLFSFDDIGGPFLTIFATNIINRGLIESDTFGIVRLNGDNVNLSRGTIRLNPLLSASSSFITTNGFFPENGVIDLEWGAGNLGSDINDILFMGGNITYATTPIYTLTNENGFSGGAILTAYQPKSYVFTNKVNDTNYLIQAVFVSNIDTNVNVDVVFDRSSVLQNARDVVVNLSHQSTNIFGGSEQRQIYVIDRLGSDTNYAVISNLLTGTTYRPANYEITRNPSTRLLVQRNRANHPLRPDLFTRFYSAEVPNGLNYSNIIVTNFYTAYNGYVLANSSAVPQVDDSSTTNLSGRVDINAGNLNLQNTKIRAEGVVNISAKHIVSTEGTLIESPRLFYQLGSTNGVLNIRNLAKKSVSRLAGGINLYSAIWTNTVVIPTNGVAAASNRRGASLQGAGDENPVVGLDAACPPGHTPLLSAFLGEPCTDGGGGPVDPVDPVDPTDPTGGTTIEVLFHILLVDGSLETETNVELNGLQTRAETTTVSDTVNVTETLQMDASKLTINGLFSIGSYFEITGQTGVKPKLGNWSYTNFPNLKYLTNNGLIVVPGSISYGVDRGVPYEVFSNTGTNVGFGHYYWTKQFDNSGLILGGIGIPDGDTAALYRDVAHIQIDTENAKLENGRIETGGRVRLNAKNVKMRNHQIVSDSSLSLSVTDNLSDAGPGSSVRVATRYGFELLVKPATGDLLGSSFSSAPPSGSEAVHKWAGEDRGATKAGFLNNAAIGRLVLEGDFSTLFTFEAVGERNAIYVDYLDLSPSIVEDLEKHLSIDSNMTVYFAGSSVPSSTLDGALNGRLRWVRDFAGANSSVEVLLRDGRTIRVNKSLRESLSIDSDGDGIFNGQDVFPFDGASSLRVEFVRVPTPKLLLSWDGAAQRVYFVEVTDSLTGGTWSTLGSVTNSSDLIETLRFEDPVSANAPRRLYRIKSNE